MVQPSGQGEAGDSSSAKSLAAALLADAALSCRKLDHLPPELEPQRRSDAYAIQHDLVARLGGIGAWKLTLAKADGEPSCAVLPVTHVRSSMTTFRQHDLPNPVELEVELAVRLASDLPPRSRPYSLEDVRAAIGSASIALEIIGSRFTDRKVVGGLATLTDFQSCGAIVVGGSVGSFNTVDLSKAPLKLYANGTLALTSERGASNEELLDGLVWLANHASHMGVGIKAGHAIITGARIKQQLSQGTVSVDATCDWGASVSATFGAL